MRRILIIDDEEPIRNMLKQMLEGANYQVDIASNGKEGLNIVHVYMPELVITDILMPQKDGMEIIVDIRKGFPEIKIIAISGGGRISSDEYLKMAKGLGAKHILKKPFKKDKLLETVNNLLM